MRVTISKRVSERGEGGETDREREKKVRTVGTHMETVSEGGKMEGGERMACSPESH